jgi:hypothetical protein
LHNPLSIFVQILKDFGLKPPLQKGVYDPALDTLQVLLHDSAWQRDKRV